MALLAVRRCNSNGIIIGSRNFQSNFAKKGERGRVKGEREKGKDLSFNK
jgi:hypothetical protein